MLTAIIFGKRIGLLEQGSPGELMEFANNNWNPYFWAALFPKLAELLRTGGLIKERVTRGTAARRPSWPPVFPVSLDAQHPFQNM